MVKDELSRYKVEDIMDRRQELIGKPLLISGIPTGYYADRESYGNRPTLAIILNNYLPCQSYSHEFSWKFHRPETNKLLAKIWGKEPEDWTQNPEINNEYIAVAAATLDNSIRENKEIELIGNLRDDGIFEFNGLKIPNIYRFCFIPRLE